MRDEDAYGGGGDWPEFSVDLEVVTRLRGAVAELASEWARVESQARTGLDGFSRGDFGAVFGEVADDYDTYAPRLLALVEGYGRLLDGAADDMVRTVRAYRETDAETRAELDSFDQGIDEAMASMPLYWRD